MDKSQTIVPFPTIRRLPGYLRLLRQCQAAGRTVISATHIAEELALESIQVRKDLGCTGMIGKPRVGFEIEPTIAAIESTLGWNCATQAFLFGAGHLGTALLGYDGFARSGLKIVAAFDSDPQLVGTTINGKQVLPLNRLHDLVRRMHIYVAVLAVPAVAAQQVAEQVVAAGIFGIWNFAPTMLALPDDVIVQNEDLSAGLALLTSRVSAGLKGRGIAAAALPSPA